MTIFEQQIAIDKAIEALMPLVQASADAGVTATIWKDASKAVRVLEQVYVALDRERKAQYCPGCGNEWAVRERVADSKYCQSCHNANDYMNI